MTRHYTLDDKIKALDAIHDEQMSFSHAEDELGISASTLSNWQKQENNLRHEHRLHQAQRRTRTMLQVQQNIADTTLRVVDHMTDEALEGASLSQLASALNALVGRFLNLQDNLNELIEQSTGEKVIRIEYYDASTGRVSDAPPWAGRADTPGKTGASARRTDDHPAGDLPAEEAVRGGGVRQTLRQDDDGADSHQRDGDTGSPDMVAGSDLPNGGAGLAGFEGYADGRDWYHD
jgi:transposase-like protein